MKSPKRTGHRRAATGGIWAAVCRDVAAVFPFLLAFYACALLLNAFTPSWGSYFYWPGFHGTVLLFAVLTSAHIAGSGWSHATRAREMRIEALTAVRAAASRLRLQTVDGAVRLGISIVAVSWAVAAGAGVIGIAVLLLGISHVLYDAVPAKAPTVLSAVFLACVPLAQALGLEGAAAWAAMYAFELLAITAFGIAARTTHDGNG